MGEGGGGKRGRPEKGRDEPQEAVAQPQAIWEVLYADDTGIVSRSRNSLAKMMADLVEECHSFGLTLFGSQDGDHVADDETYARGQGHIRY